MQAQWVTQPEEFGATDLAQWRTLAIQQGRPYCLPEWMLAWWRHAAPADAEFRVLILREGDVLVGVGPFFLHRRFGLRHLRFLGAGTSSTVAPLVKDGARPYLAAAIRELMFTEHVADVVMLEGIPADERWLDEIGGTGSQHEPKLHLLHGWTQANPKLNLSEEGFDQWFHAKGGKFRARMRRGQRKLQSLGGQHVLSTGGGDFAVPLSEFERLHMLRWKSRGGSGVLSTAVSNMLADFAASSPSNLRIWAVEVDGRTVSVQVFVTAGGTVSHWLGGIDDSFTEVHPGAGVLSLYSAIEHAWKSADRIFDFGSGGQEFKYQFADREYQLEWSGAARARWCMVAARLPILREQTLLAVAGRLPSGSKRRLRRLQKRIRRVFG